MKTQSLLIASLVCALSPAAFADDYYDCHVVAVATYANRAHVECKEPAPFQFFGLPINSPMVPSLMALGEAARVNGTQVMKFSSAVCLAGGQHGAGAVGQNPDWFIGCNEARGDTKLSGVINSADASGDVLHLVYNARDTSTGPTFGCVASNCRPLLGFYRRNQ